MNLSCVCFVDSFTFYKQISRREAVVQERIDLEHLQMNPERLTARGPNAREERCV